MRAGDQEVGAKEKVQLKRIFQLAFPIQGRRMNDQKEVGIEIVDLWRLKALVTDIFDGQGMEMEDIPQNCQGFLLCKFFQAHPQETIEVGNGRGHFTNR